MKDRLGSLVGLLVVGALAACGDSGSSGGGGSGGSAPADCAADPFACEAGTTCWIAADQTSFACLLSGPNAEGEACKNFYGEPTCQDGLVCLQLAGASEGVCARYCDLMDPNRGCPADSQCSGVQLADTVFHACAPQGGTGGAGTGGAGGMAAGGAGGAGGGL